MRHKLRVDPLPYKPARRETGVVFTPNGDDSIISALRYFLLPAPVCTTMSYDARLVQRE